MKKLWLMVAVFSSLIISPAMALDFSDDFNSPTLNTFWWEISSSGSTSVSHVNDRIEMTQGADESSGSLAFKFSITGDFSAAVNYEILDPVTAGYNNERIGLSGSFGAVERVSDSRFGGEVYLTHFASAGVSPSISTLDTKGRLLVTRVDNLMTGYFWDKSSPDPVKWAPISTGAYSADDTTVGVSIWPWNATPGVKVAFDNFTLSAPETVVTPEPASMVLFGLGGAAMAFARRRSKA